MIRTRIEHFAGRRPRAPRFALNPGPVEPVLESNESYASLTADPLQVRVYREGPWRVEYWEDGELLTSSVTRSVGAVASD